MEHDGNGHGELTEMEAAVARVLAKNGTEAQPDPEPVLRVWDGDPPPLAYEHDLLERFDDAHHQAGVIGEIQLARLTYLTLTSRLLSHDRPLERLVSLAPVGVTSSGKSHTTSSTVKFFPEHAVFEITNMSDKFIHYLTRDLRHTFIYVPEYSAIQDNDAILTALRVLLSEGRLVYGVVEKDGNGRMVERLIEKEGPTGLLMTTTKVSIDPELATRLVCCPTDDSPEQTRRVMVELARLDTAGVSFDFQPWIELQLWLECQDNRTTLPFLGALAQLMPASTVRLRRDFTTLVSLVRAHAVLHQLTRERDQEGRIVASLTDYERCQKILDNLFAIQADKAVADGTRDVVQAVHDLLADNTNKEHITPRDLDNHLDIGKATVYRRVNDALAAGYLVNLSEGRGKKLKTGAPMPEREPHFLPSTDALFAYWKDHANDLAELYTEAA